MTNYTEDTKYLWKCSCQ